MLDFYIAGEMAEIQRDRMIPRVSLDGAVYWFLHRYFAHANLDPSDFSFLNLYEDTELSGYQIHRLLAELNQALLDLGDRTDDVDVLVGWHGTDKSIESEDWRGASVADVRRAIQSLAETGREALESGKAIYAIGD